MSQGVIPYGVNDLAPDEGMAGAFAMELDRLEGRPLRLNTMAWTFATPPDLLRLSDTPARLDFLCRHLQSLCGLWDRLPRRFLEVYFRAIGATIAENRKTLEAALGASRGLFAVEDWSFSALCPLPRAHLPSPDGNESARLRVDFAFWTGARLIAIDLIGISTPGRARRLALAALREAGIHLIEIAMPALQDENAARTALAPLLDHFWRGERLPSSPFRPAALAAIEPTSSPGA